MADLRMGLDRKSDRSHCLSQPVFDPVRRQDEGGPHEP
jgi:hypothetical protein